MSEIKVLFDRTRFPKSAEKLSAEQRHALIARLWKHLRQLTPPNSRRLEASAK
jgi:hypothetical protein